MASLYALYLMPLVVALISMQSQSPSASLSISVLSSSDSVSFATHSSSHPRVICATVVVSLVLKAVFTISPATNAVLFVELGH